ncbi:2-isopropylmalate synthase [Amycolatopsis sp. NBC_00345]|uniref:2-isopropylmalate synthase n=1 Tax=Amycolatopsis sp. NBC_00345 TaxID=2975955 RepID=UPI002E26D973
MPQHPPAEPDSTAVAAPGGIVPPGRPRWNPQRASGMPFRRYARTEPRVPALEAREWPRRSATRAPSWASVDLRDGNQALSAPMDPRRKARMFDLMVRMGFKEIEVGYPSASDADFSFVRELVERDRVPDDVTISVFTPARPDLIDRTFEAIAGASHAMVHLCHATACLWREEVYGMTRAEVRRMALDSADRVSRRADEMPGSRLRFEYSPETFNVTELEYALEISNGIISRWDASPDRPVTLNLPSTVETDSPNVFADQIEWMHRNVERRESVILSVHPHNDRGTAVAAAELAGLAGADRVEGTLFGNGERTGNVCLVVLALNLFAQGIDPQLDLSDLDEIRRTVEYATRMEVPARYPYGGDLVYTAFSGTHQDAIAKGLAAMERRARETGVSPADLPWAVPYLPIDPKDVGRTYESIVRVNSQSGKGGVAHVLKHAYGYDLPPGLRADLAKRVQRAADERGTELTSRELHTLFVEEYLERGDLLVKEVRIGSGQRGTTVEAVVVFGDGAQAELSGTGANAEEALVRAIAAPGTRLAELTLQPVSGRTGKEFAAYARVENDEATAYGVGLEADERGARLAAIVSAVGRIGPLAAEGSD